MRNTALIFILFVFAYHINAQTNSCKVLHEKIAGDYSGKCLNGLANGKGKSIGEDTYIGIFKDGLPHGNGKYLYKNGDVFQGNWKNGKKDGKGKFVFTQDGKRQKMYGYWKDDEYVGADDPDLPYRVIASSGIVDHDFKKNESSGEHDNEINLVIRSAFTDFTPVDLRIENSSGQVIQSGKRFKIIQYLFPFRCEISYTLLVGQNRKQCQFIFEVLQEGRYSITLHND
ncbi:MAG: hypothetical protein PHG67_02755 [Bacteroidales bacterium]|jgi:hypothetical protein|nr:hypothetical protein [Bacteroidales bacterium]